MGRTLLVAVALLLLAGPAAAQIALYDGDDLRLGLSGYVRTFTGIHDRGFDLPELFPGTSPERTSGFHSQVGRARWQLAGRSWRFDLHNRLQLRVPGDEQGPGVGFGVTAVPDRLVDLETDLITTPDVGAWHDIDRLSLSLFTDAADLTIGRQAITWGVSSVFPVADLWARFSPFEMDTEEKPGVDAARALFYPVEGLEMDAVVADRGGSLDDLSVGLRGTYAHSAADLWAGAGKFWRQAMLMGGATLMLDEARVRGEVVLPWGLDGGGMQDPRVTVGYDWIRSDLAFTAEYHFNGIGAASADGYTAVARDPRYTRGETYYLGRHYLGGLVSWSPDAENRASVALNALVNVQDPSAALTPMIGYDLGQSTRLSLGGLLSLGDTPAFAALTPLLRSEFGTYGSLLFTRLSVYF